MLRPDLTVCCTFSFIISLKDQNYNLRIDSRVNACFNYKALELNRKLRAALDSQNVHGSNNNNFSSSSSSSRLQQQQQSSALVLPPLAPGRGSVVVAAALGNNDNHQTTTLTREQQHRRRQMQQSSSDANGFGATSSRSGSGGSSSGGNKVDLGPAGKPRRTRENYTFPSREIDRIERENQQVSRKLSLRTWASKAACLIFTLMPTSFS